MIGKGWRRLLVIAGAMLIAALALAGMVSRPSGDCEQVQSRILIAGPYEQVPARAGDAARVICERNGNIPERSLFRRFEQP
jgi:hypothetical protein